LSRWARISFSLLTSALPVQFERPLFAGRGGGSPLRNSSLLFTRGGFPPSSFVGGDPSRYRLRLVGVLDCRSPPKISEAIVRRSARTVKALNFGRARTYKGFQNETVNVAANDFPASAILSQTDYDVTASVGAAVLRDCNESPSVHRPNRTVFADEVSRIGENRSNPDS
jgi:hypothetical protein